jgi:hypothetical protein
MHYLAYVVIPPDGDPNEHIDKALAPWNEEVSDRGFWDWYVIGGRWTGHFDGYDPTADPANQETCTLCHGTGTRDWSPCNVTPEWIAECGGCNGCQGTGTSTKWSTQWAQRDEDVVPVPAALTKTLEGDGPFTIVAGEAVLQRETYLWDKEAKKGEFLQTPDFDTKVAAILTDADPTWRVAVVDYHC